MRASKVRRAIQAGSYETSPTTAVKANPSCSASAASLLESNHSHASQLAKSVCIFSPWQFLYWYDLPPGAASAGSVI
jgi:hypothetical protein